MQQLFTKFTQSSVTIQIVLFKFLCRRNRLQDQCDAYSVTIGSIEPCTEAISVNRTQPADFGKQFFKRESKPLESKKYLSQFLVPNFYLFFFSHTCQSFIGE